MNPFGEDDDDFDINMMIDRNLQVGHLVKAHFIKYEKIHDNMCAKKSFLNKQFSYLVLYSSKKLISNIHYDMLAHL